MDVNQTYCGDHFAVHTSTESSRCTPKTNTASCQLYLSKKSVGKWIGKQTDESNKGRNTHTHRGEDSETKGLVRERRRIISKLPRCHFLMDLPPSHRCIQQVPRSTCVYLLSAFCSPGDVARWGALSSVLGSSSCSKWEMRLGLPTWYPTHRERHMLREDRAEDNLFH